MKAILTVLILAGALSTGAYAQQKQNDPPAKAAKAKKTAKSACSGAQGGVDVSGAESVEMQSKAGKRAGANCGKSNGKAATPEAAPTTAHPETNDPVIKK